MLFTLYKNIFIAHNFSREIAQTLDKLETFQCVCVVRLCSHMLSVYFTLSVRVKTEEYFCLK